MEGAYEAETLTRGVVMHQTAALSCASLVWPLAARAAVAGD
jgi:hypothetical protein